MASFCKGNGFATSLSICCLSWDLYAGCGGSEERARDEWVGR